MHNISFFSWFVFDEFIAKVLILSFYVDFELFLALLSFCVDFELFLALSCHFAWLCRFFCLLLTFVVSLLLDDILELLLSFWVF
jgi:hypothetical protein